ncbi:hypothetical protein DdX_19535 [Ditylenchus destructor]|uniref:Uncharacterized protein n=1 Tax=Ditylenchus destructor TaxID=166010 RepID=A0AAD4QX21_9BILA|nr:hypothetical protein DdX_19535 [Ditylenchus destructor]
MAYEKEWTQKYDFMKQQIRTIPGNPVFHRDLALCAFKLGHHYEACTCLDLAFILDPDDEDTRTAILECAGQNPRFKEEMRYGSEFGGDEEEGSDEGSEYCMEAQMRQQYQPAANEPKSRAFNIGTSLGGGQYSRQRTNLELLTASPQASASGTTSKWNGGKSQQKKPSASDRWTFAQEEFVFQFWTNFYTKKPTPQIVQELQGADIIINRNPKAIQRIIEKQVHVVYAAINEFNQPDV